ncbi:MULTISPECIES: GGDEF domain-containing protein [Metabacillus]|uniref:GGDEF domain-containing protein n=1 Tax=Metabacillus TaxID=2675233 RepID=UPI000C80320D|nr:hypothetical protein CJ195_21240 [Bacillus sp. UMB0899]
MCGHNGSVGRYGGEEFIVILENANDQKATEISNLLLEALRLTPLQLDSDRRLFLTVSIGICSNQGNRDLSINEMIQKADECLYRAKNMGRDQVVIYNTSNKSLNVKL